MSDARAGRHGEDQPVHLVLELADVPWPAIRLQRLERVRREAAGGALLLRLEPPEERRQEGEDVAAPMPQRRDPQRKHRQPVVEVAPEASGVDLVLESAVAWRR